MMHSNAGGIRPKGVTWSETVMPAENSGEEKVVDDQFKSLSNVITRRCPGYLIHPVDIDVNLIPV